MKEIQLVSAANAAVTVTSTALDTGDLKDYSLHADFSSATLAGTIKLQSSNDNSDWIDISGASQAIAAGESHMFNVIGAQYRYARVVWTPTAGTGTLTCKTVQKETPVKGS